MSALCEFCGASSARQCELRDETDGVCPWEEIMEDKPGTDFRSKTRHDMRRLWPLEPDDGRGDFLYDLRGDR